MNVLNKQIEKKYTSDGKHMTLQSEKAGSLLIDTLIYNL